MPKPRKMRKKMIGFRPSQDLYPEIQEHLKKWPHVSITDFNEAAWRCYLDAIKKHGMDPNTLMPKKKGCKP